MDEDPPIPGVLYEIQSDINSIKENLKELIKSENKKEWDINRFPGSHPVSITRSNMKLLENNEYVVTEKSDGVRYLLLLLNVLYYIIFIKIG